MTASKQANSLLGLSGLQEHPTSAFGKLSRNCNISVQCPWKYPYCIKPLFLGSKSVSKVSPYMSISLWAMVLSAQVPREASFHYHVPEVSWTKEWQKRRRRPSRLSLIPLHNEGSLLIILWLETVHTGVSSDGYTISSTSKVPLFDYCYDWEVLLMPN